MPIICVNKLDTAANKYNKVNNDLQRVTSMGTTAFIELMKVILPNLSAGDDARKVWYKSGVTDQLAERQVEPMVKAKSGRGR